MSEKKPEKKPKKQASARARSKAPGKARPKKSPAGQAPPAPAPPSSPPDPRFAPVIAAFRDDGQVTYGGKGFGSSGLKVDGRLFALISSRGLFVAKLPKQRVDELVRAGKGDRFDPGHGRAMKEWIALDDGAASWVALAREAHRFVRDSGG